MSETFFSEVQVPPGFRPPLKTYIPGQILYKPKLESSVREIHDIYADILLYRSVEKYEVVGISKKIYEGDFLKKNLYEDYIDQFFFKMIGHYEDYRLNGPLYPMAKTETISFYNQNNIRDFYDNVDQAIQKALSNDLFVSAQLRISL